MNRLTAWAFLFVLAACPPVLDAESIQNWVNARIAKVRARNLIAVDDSLLIAANDSSLTRQEDSASAVDRSTSLVDQSSATQFFSVATSLVPVGTFSSGSKDTAAGAGTVTVTAYSLFAALARKNLYDPQFYKAHIGARRFSITAGTSASDIDKDNTDKPGKIIGFKYAFLNQREVFTPANLQKIGRVQTSISESGLALNKVKTYAEHLFFVSCGLELQCSGANVVADAATLRTKVEETPADFISFNTKIAAASIDNLTLPASLLAALDAEIARNLPSLDATQTLINEVYDSIQKGRQLALSYTFVQRPDNGNDDHRAQLVFDWGLDPRLNWTLNASGDYKDRKIGLDSRGGRLATELQARLGDLSREANSRLPATLSFAGEAKWMTLLKPQYTFQTKLTIPLGAGLNLPISYRWANRKDFIEANDSEVRFGFTVDLGSLLLAAKK